MSKSYKHHEIKPNIQNENPFISRSLAHIVLPPSSRAPTSHRYLWFAFIGLESHSLEYFRHDQLDQMEWADLTSTWGPKKQSLIWCTSNNSECLWRDSWRNSGWLPSCQFDFPNIPGKWNRELQADKKNCAKRKNENAKILSSVLPSMSMGNMVAKSYWAKSRILFRWWEMGNNFFTIRKRKLLGCHHIYLVFQT